MKQELSIIVSSVVSSTVTWFFSRRKYSSEVNASEIENVKGAILIYKQMAMDLKVELDETKALVKELNQRLIDIENNRKGWKQKK